MARVVVVRVDRRKPVIVTLDHLRTSGALSTEGVRFSWRPGQASAVDAAEIAQGRDVGTVEVLAESPGGAGARLPYDVTFAFVAHAFHPDVPILGK
jgi:hypothetical protein